MIEPQQFTYAGKTWNWAVVPFHHKDGRISQVRKIWPNGHRPLVAQYKRAAKALERKLLAKAGHA